MMQETKGMGQRYIKEATNDCSLFDSWLSSKNLVEAAMYFGANTIDMVKTNTKGFSKETNKKLIKDWTGGSYLVLRRNPMVPGGTSIIAIGYKYNARKFYILLLHKTQGAQRQALSIYISTLTSFLMLPFTLLLAPFSCISSFAMLIRLTPTTNQVNLI